MVTANRFWYKVFGVALSNNRCGYVFHTFCPIVWLMGFFVRYCLTILQSSAYDFVSQELKATEDLEFETFYTKNILLNEGIHLWMAVQDQPHENFQFP